MKRAKRLYILFGVLVAVCIATVCVLQYDQKQEEIQTSGESILTVDADTVSALDWETETASSPSTRTAAGCTMRTRRFR